MVESALGGAKDISPVKEAITGIPTSISHPNFYAPQKSDDPSGYLSNSITIGLGIFFQCLLLHILTMRVGMTIRDRTVLKIHRNIMVK